MCLLTFFHDGVTPCIDDLTTGSHNNPDGFGFAIHDRTQIISFSSLNFDETLDKFLSVRAKHSGPGLFHSRITTHGGTSLDNCHPFTIGNDPLTVMAHNGMLPIEASNGRSDTRILAEDYIPAWGGAPLLNNKKRRKKLSKFADGSKLVFLSANPDVQNDWYIINENDGHWVNGVWWSNNSYKWARYSYSGSGMYTSGWGRVEHKPTPSDDYVEERVWVKDLSFTDRDGSEVWAEQWVCMNCLHEEYVDEDNIDWQDNCPKCDCCWYCTEDRLMCYCGQNKQYDMVPFDDVPADIGGTRSLTIPNYDSQYDYF
jgi:hypothetical protein